MQFLKCASAVLLAVPIFGSGGHPDRGLTVHEWGTFTTIADGNGGAQPWSPLASASDLPCFVERLNGMAYKMMPQRPDTPASQTITVRMETPVVYFYSPRKTTLRVSVDFPKGLITEWFPAASKVSPGRQLSLPPVRGGHIEWNSVEVAPGENAVLPSVAGSSHYFAARHADADLIRVGQQREKLLFYRGVANFGVPLSARITNDNSFELHNTGGTPLALAVLFENRAGKIGFRILHGFAGTTRLAEPTLTSSLDELTRELSNALVGQGLHRKEADAMIDTWRDSWFEEGARVFYLVPRTLVDRELPLSIQPAPASVARVFVGREEILAPFLRDRLMTALSTGNTTALDRFGRFLAPFIEQVKVTAAPSVASYLTAKAREAQQEFFQPTCVR